MMRLAAHADAYVLVSGDGDYVEAIEYLQSEKGLRVEVISAAQCTSQALLDACDLHTDLATYPICFGERRNKLSAISNQPSTRSSSARLRGATFGARGSDNVDRVDRCKLIADGWRAYGSPITRTSDSSSTPSFPRTYVDWELPDPAGATPEQVRGLRDDIAARVRTLLHELLHPEASTGGQRLDDAVLRLLADPLRARIVELLASEALCTSHLVELTGARQTNISNHLKLLREAGLTTTEPCGRFTYNLLVPDRLRLLGEQLMALADTTAAGVVRRACP
jgi:ArsR family transcriptional regulator